MGKKYRGGAKGIYRGVRGSMGPPIRGGEPADWALVLVLQQIDTGIRQTGYDEGGKAWLDVHTRVLAMACSMREDAVIVVLRELVRRGSLLYRRSGDDVLGAFAIAPGVEPGSWNPTEPKAHHAFIAEQRNPGSVDVRNLGFHERKLIEDWRRRQEREP